MRLDDLIPSKRFLRPDEVAGVLLLSRRTIYRMIEDRRMPAVRLGSGPWRIPRDRLIQEITFYDPDP
jgi:excisionase family DNA binding protein